MIHLDHLIATLQRHVASELPDSVPLVLPGIVLDGETAAEWIEFWCDSVQGVVQRDTPSDLREVSLTLQVFVRSSAATTRVSALADVARATVSGRLIEVIDRTISEEPVVGAIRFQEADVRDLTRIQAEHQRRPLRHVVVTVRGVVQAFV